MRRIGLAVVLSLGLALTSFAGEAQHPRNVPRIGVLETASITARDHTWSAFHQRLRELGYAEGQSIAFEMRSAGGKTERLRRGGGHNIAGNAACDDSPSERGPAFSFLRSGGAARLTYTKSFRAPNVLVHAARIK